MRKNGIHSCVCQFFFVSLQPIYVCACVRAFIHGVKVYGVQCKIEY